MSMGDDCYCGSGRKIDNCCGIYLEGKADAPTPEALMRSRYSAYVTGNNDHLLRTWHAETRPENLDVSADTGDWAGLEVLDSRQDGDAGIVEFRAFYRDGGRMAVLHERSRFVREQGRWFYVDGDQVKEKPVKVGRNDPCPCGSGKKFKRCCG